MLKKVFFVFIMCLFFTFQALAQNPIYDTTGKIGIGIRADYMNSNSYSYRERDIERENQLLIGGSLYYGINEWFSMELSYDSALSSEIKDKTLGVKLADIYISPLTLSAQFRYISKDPDIYKWIVPYLTIGIGYYFVDGDLSDNYRTYNTPNETSLDFDGGFGGHIGVGTDFFVNKNVSMGFEARYYKFTAEIKETQVNPILNISQSHKEDLDMDGWMFGVNVKFYFSIK